MGKTIRNLFVFFVILSTERWSGPLPVSRDPNGRNGSSPWVTPPKRPVCVPQRKERNFRSGVRASPGRADAAIDVYEAILPQVVLPGDEVRMLLGEKQIMDSRVPHGPAMGMP